MTSGRRPGAIRMATDLERIGDLPKPPQKAGQAVGKTSRRARCPVRSAPWPLWFWVRSRKVISLYASRSNADGLQALRVDDEKVDIQYDSVPELLTYMMEDQHHVLRISFAQNLERIGDHVTTSQENAYYLPTAGTGCPADTSRWTKPQPPDISRWACAMVLHPGSGRRG